MTAVTTLRTQWSYCSLVPSHRYRLWVNFTSRLPNHNQTTHCVILVHNSVVAFNCGPQYSVWLYLPQSHHTSGPCTGCSWFVWNGNIVILTNVSQLTALEVVYFRWKLSQMTFSFQYWTHSYTISVPFFTPHRARRSFDAWIKYWRAPYEVKDVQCTAFNKFSMCQTSYKIHAKYWRLSYGPVRASYIVYPNGMLRFHWGTGLIRKAPEGWCDHKIKRIMARARKPHVLFDLAFGQIKNRMGAKTRTGSVVWCDWDKRTTHSRWWRGETIPMWKNHGDL